MLGSTVLNDASGRRAIVHPARIAEAPVRWMRHGPAGEVE